jgi:hypothetical protein
MVRKSSAARFLSSRLLMASPSPVGMSIMLYCSLTCTKLMKDKRCRLLNGDFPISFWCGIGRIEEFDIWGLDWLGMVFASFVTNSTVPLLHGQFRSGICHSTANQLTPLTPLRSS